MEDLTELSISAKGKASRNPLEIKPIQWLVIILIITYLVLIIIGFIPENNRLELNEMILVILLIILVLGFINKISEIIYQDGGLKIKLVDIQRKQEDLEVLIRAIGTALEGIINKYEIQHLNKLLDGHQDNVSFNPIFFGELEHLDSLGFIAPNKRNGIMAIQNEHGNYDEEFNLKEYVKITDKGISYLNALNSIQRNVLFKNTAVPVSEQE
jgi:hypothetical protein